MKTEIIRNLYVSLLADVSRELGIDTMSPPDTVDLVAWCIKDAPVLDKQLVRCLGDLPAFKYWEHYCAPWNSEAAAQWPEWLRPLLDQLDHDVVAHLGDFVKGIRHLRTLLGFCYKIEHAPAKTQIEEAQRLFSKQKKVLRLGTARLVLIILVLTFVMHGSLSSESSIRELARSCLTALLHLMAQERFIRPVSHE